jgi:hypothetical protein
MIKCNQNSNFGRSFADAIITHPNSDFHRKSSPTQGYGPLRNDCL